MARAAVSFGMALHFFLGPLFFGNIGWATKAMSGETGGVMGDNREEAANLIARVIFNRLESSRFPDTAEDVVRQGFPGHENRIGPDEAMVGLVIEALIQHLFGKRFPAMYMFSYHDCENLGYSRDEAIICLDGIDGFGLCFFEDMPGGKK